MSWAIVGGATNVFYYPPQDSYLVILANFTPEFSEEMARVFYGKGVIGEAGSLFGDLEGLILE